MFAEKSSQQRVVSFSLEGVLLGRHSDTFTSRKACMLIIEETKRQTTNDQTLSDKGPNTIQQ